MRKITSQDIQNIANLARLEIKQDELETYTNDISNVFNLIENMQSVNTENITAAKHPWHTHQRLREDKVTETNQRDIMQHNAPEQMGGLYLVPKVVE